MKGRRIDRPISVQIADSNILSDDDLDQIITAKKEFDCREDINIYITSDDLLKLRNFNNINLRLISSESNIDHRLRQKASPRKDLLCKDSICLPKNSHESGRDISPKMGKLHETQSQDSLKIRQKKRQDLDCVRNTCEIMVGNNKYIISYDIIDTKYSIFLVKSIANDIICSGITDGQIQVKDLRDMHNILIEIAINTTKININVYAADFVELKFPIYMHIVTVNFECNIHLFMTLMPQILESVTIKK